MRLVDTELERMICYKVGKFCNEELEESDIQIVEELSLSNKSLSGKLKNMSLNELQKFQNIKSLVLQHFVLDDSIIKVLNSLTNLHILQLASCEYKANTKLTNSSLQNIIIYCCKIHDYSKINASEIFQIVGEESLSLNELAGKENIKRMSLMDCNVKKFRTIDEFIELQKLDLEGTQVDDKTKLEELKRRISVSEKQEYLPNR